MVSKFNSRTTSQSHLSRQVSGAIQKCHDYLLDIQYPEGYWWGELESNATMEAEFILMNHFLGIAEETKIRKLANHIISRQRDDGAWVQFYGAPGDLSSSIECYFALKLAGVSPQAPRMRKAREFILSKGGVPNARVFTKIWLALFRQWDWKGIPVMPAELMLLPEWSPVNIYSFASWARATIVPLLIILDRKPEVAIPEWARIDELYPLPRSETSYSVKHPGRLIGWETFFYAGDVVLRQIERLPWKPTRGKAIERASEWIIAHQEDDGSWGGIQPPWVYSLMALNALGYDNDHPVMRKGLRGFDTFAIEDGDTLRVQACVSPNWDTCLAMIALLDSDLPPDHPALTRAAEYLLARQIMEGGDWQVKAKDLSPGGWAFEFENKRYPDLDDTAEIVMALNKARLPSEQANGEHGNGNASAQGASQRKQRAIDRAVQWLLGMQCSNGGWASFDKDNSLKLVAKIPFADFGEIIDPPSVDVTAHVLEMLGQCGYSADHPAVSRALDYILAEQESDGAWFGRWGVNYIYGIGAALPALQAVGFDMSADCVRRAVQWLAARQNPDGGWGESCASYVDPEFRGKGPSAPSQTAWAIIALLAAGESAHQSTRRGIQFLIERQQPDGSWDEPYFTGTGFPGYRTGERQDRYLSPDDHAYQGRELPAGFMINYHLYRIYWPLTALGRYRRHTERRRDG